MTNLIDEKMFTFSELGRDDDYFLTKDDMSESHWELLMSCHHQGACDEDAREASNYFQFPSDSALIKACIYLIECGIEKERFLSEMFSGDFRKITVDDIDDSDAVMMYYLWMLAGDIQERE